MVEYALMTATLAFDTVDTTTASLAVAAYVTFVVDLASWPLLPLPGAFTKEA